MAAAPTAEPAATALTTGPLPARWLVAGSHCIEPAACQQAGGRGRPVAIRLTYEQPLVLPQFSQR